MNNVCEKETAVVEPIMTDVVFFNLRLMLTLQLPGKQYCSLSKIQHPSSTRARDIVSVQCLPNTKWSSEDDFKSEKYIVLIW